MIISNFEEGNRSANVCRQGKSWVVMVYENDQYLETFSAYNENQAEIIAEDWVLKVDSQ
jgi:superoxide dismutase